MDLQDYQIEACKTAHERAYHLEYLLPGIMGEVGELFGRKAKGYWHGWDEEKLNEELASEYGDIAWMTALLLIHFDVHDIEGWPSGGGWETSDLWDNLFLMAGSLQVMPEVLGAQTLWHRLELYCKTITGHDFDYVLRKNLQKLADRQARGTLVGEGNHR